MEYESRRITISYFAAAKVCKTMGLPMDCRPQALASALEQMIFEMGCDRPYKSDQDRNDNSQKN